MELDDNVGEECNLAGNVEEEEVARESTEKAELQWGEAGGMYRPYQYEVCPKVV